MSRIKPPKSREKTTFIDIQKISKDYAKPLKELKYLKFSFKFLDLNDELFRIDKCDSGWFIQLFERKKSYCLMTPTDIKMGGKNTRCHPITWANTEKPNGFEIPGLGDDINEYQLSVSKNKGRIIGFFVDETFYVVWFDPNHKLCP